MASKMVSQQIVNVLWGVMVTCFVLLVIVGAYTFLTSKKDNQEIDQSGAGEDGTAVQDDPHFNLPPLPYTDRDDRPVRGPREE